jgi:glycyl-tRNA synthetase beta chain
VTRILIALLAFLGRRWQRRQVREARTVHGSTDSRRGRSILQPAASGVGEAGLRSAGADADEGRGTLLVEIGCEELPASACYEAEAQLPRLVEAQLGVEPSRVYVSPRRVAFLVDDLPETAADRLVKGPPADRGEQAASGFARKHGLSPDQLEERDGVLWARLPGEALRGELLLERLRAVVHGLQFGKSMRWDGDGHRFARPVRWACEKLDAETLWGSGTSFGHRFTDGEIEIAAAGDYEDALRSARVEPDAGVRRRRIVEALDALGEWRDPLGKLDEVVYMVEWPLVLDSAFDERFLRLPSQVIETAMQSHQRYFPLGENRFAVVAAGGDEEVIRPGYTQVLEARLEDAAFTFDRDVAVGIEELASHLDRITFFEGGGTLADKAARLVELVEKLGGDDAALQAARLAKADQASELVREFADLEGQIGAEYARLAGRPEEVCKAIAEQYLPDAADAPLPTTNAGRLLSAADKIDTLSVSFSLGHRPTGSRDPYGLRRAAIGLCRLAVEGGVTVPHSLLSDEVREFVEERLEGYLDVPVEFVRAARAGETDDVGAVAALALFLAAQELAGVHEVYTRARRIVGDGADEAPVDDDLLVEPAERALATAVADAPEPGAGPERLYEWSAALAPVVETFFVDVLVMDPDERVRANRLRLLRDVRAAVGRLGDLSQIPL